MISITVFGKPKAFESCTYVFNEGSTTTVVNAHSEPLLKPLLDEDSVLHYFSDGKTAGLEYYTRAKGYESDRPGIVFGVAVTSDTDFGLTNAIINILQPLWQDFAGALLDDDNRFKTPSMLDQLTATGWSPTEIEQINRASYDSGIKATSENTLLLEATRIKDIDTVEEKIKEYSDVYIADIDIFRDVNNEIVLRRTDGIVYKISEGEIKPIEIKPIEESQDIQSVKSATRQSEQLETSSIKSSQLTSDSGNTIKTNKRHKPSISLYIIISVIVGFILGYTYFSCIEKSTNQIDNKSFISGLTKIGRITNHERVKETLANNVILLKEYQTPINEFLHLAPEIKSNEDILKILSFKVSDQSLVSIDDRHILHVEKRPKEDTPVSVTVLINGQVIGQQTYIIAKAK